MRSTPLLSETKAGPAFLSIPQVAMRWGVHPRTIRRMIKSGCLSAVQVGRQYRIPSDGLQHFEQKNCTPGGRRRSGT
jgi:excisionase family DNA binding protein